MFCDKAFNAKSQKMIEIKGVFLQWFMISFNKKSTLLAQSKSLATRDKSASGGAAKNGNMSNQHPLNLVEELHKTIIRLFEKLISILNFYTPYLEC